MNGRSRDAGVVLINVLVILSIASIVVFLMLSSQEISLAKARALASATAAEALARGAESSAVTALRRDMETAPETDHYAEPWAEIAQTETALDTGSFSVRVRDAQARLNLSRLRNGAAGELQVLLRVMAELDIPRAVGARIAGEVAARPGLISLSDLRGITPDTAARIAPYMDFLSSDATLNLNTADPVLLRAILNNRSAALRLELIRESAQFLSPDDLAKVGVIRPPGAGFTSQTFEVEATAQVDEITVRLVSRIERQETFEGRSVVVTRRLYGIPANSVPTMPVE